MPMLSRFNKPAFRVFLRTAGWLLLFALVPAAIYRLHRLLWTGGQVFLGIAFVTTLGLLWAFWGALFPKGVGER